MGDLLTMKCLPECDRPYEKIERHGTGTLTDSELLAVIIKTGTKNLNAVDAARKILLKAGNDGLCGVADMSLQELMQTEGIGRVKAIQLQAVFEIARRIGKKSDVFKNRVKDINLLGEFLSADMSALKQEVFRTILLDVHCRIINMIDVSVGTVDGAIVHPREVFAEAVRCACSSVILVHNHPGGSINPSVQDIKTTERLIISGEIIGIEVKDNIIVGASSFYSMAEEGEIDRIKRQIRFGGE